MIGPLVGPLHIVDAFRSTLKLWAPSVLAELAIAGTQLKPPALIDMPLTVDALSSAQTPGIAVAVTGLLEEPERSARGTYNATWGVTVRVLARGDSFESTASAVYGYEVLVRTVVMQHASLGIGARTHWLGEEFAVIDPSSSRTLGGLDIAFGVELRDVLDGGAGPAVPPDPGAPPIPYPPIATTEAIVHPQEE